MAGRKIASATCLWAAGGAASTHAALTAFSHSAAGAVLAEHGALEVTLVAGSSLFFASVGAMRGGFNAAEYILIDRQLLVRPVERVLSAVLPGTSAISMDATDGRLQKAVREVYDRGVAHIRSRGLVSRTAMGAVLPRLDAVLERCARAAVKPMRLPR